MSAESKEAVALALLEILATVEKKRLTVGGQHDLTDRQWVLAAYAQCLRATSGIAQSPAT
jgi:hypothetical protein